MAVTRQMVKDLPKGPKKDHYKIVLRDMMDNYKWTNKIYKDIGILLTGHPGGRPFLKASLETHKKLGYWILLTYDNYFDPNNKNISYEQCFPKRDVFDLADSFLIPHHQSWGGVQFPYFFLLYQGVMNLGNFPYIFCSNADCIIEKPEGFSTLFDMFKKSNADIFPIGWEENNGRPLLNTTSFIAKTEAIQKMMVHFRDYFIGEDISTYEKYVDKFGNTEGRFARAAIDLNLKVLKPEENPINTQVSECSGTWGKTIGFRHIHAEYNNAFRRKKIPPHYKYLDNRYMTAKYNQIKEYYNEKDKKKKQNLLEKIWNSK